MNRCIGIDPGVKGGIACVEKTRNGYRILWAEPMPIVQTQDRPTVDIRRVANRLPPGEPVSYLIEIPTRGMGKNPSSQAALQFQCGELCGFFGIGITVPFSQTFGDTGSGCRLRAGNEAMRPGRGGYSALT